jgi:hypothetical protein
VLTIRDSAASVRFLFQPLILNLSLTLLVLYAFTDGEQERAQVGKDILLRHMSLPVEQNEQLVLHRVHLWQGEAKPLVIFHHSVLSPMLVLGARIIQALGGYN